MLLTGLLLHNHMLFGPTPISATYVTDSRLDVEAIHGNLQASFLAGVSNWMSAFQTHLDDKDNALTSMIRNYQLPLALSMVEINIEQLKISFWGMDTSYQIHFPVGLEVKMDNRINPEYHQQTFVHIPNVDIIFLIVAKKDEADEWSQNTAIQSSQNWLQVAQIHSSLDLHFGMKLPNATQDMRNQVDFLQKEDVVTHRCRQFYQENLMLKSNVSNDNRYYPKLRSSIEEFFAKNSFNSLNLDGIPTLAQVLMNSEILNNKPTQSPINPSFIVKPSSDAVIIEGKKDDDNLPQTPIPLHQDSIVNYLSEGISSLQVPKKKSDNSAPTSPLTRRKAELKHKNDVFDDDWKDPINANNLRTSYGVTSIPTEQKTYSVSYSEFLKPFKIKMDNNGAHDKITMSFSAVQKNSKGGSSTSNYQYDRNKETTNISANPAQHRQQISNRSGDGICNRQNENLSYLRISSNNEAFQVKVTPLLSHVVNDWILSMAKEVICLFVRLIEQFEIY